MDEAIYDALAERLAAGETCALATIIATRGSTPQRAGAKALFTAAGAIVGTIGGGCLENEARLRALDVLRDGRPVLIEVDLTHDYDQDTGLICGGKAEILIERPALEQAAFYAFARELHHAATPAVCAARVDGDGLAQRAIVAEDGAGQGDDSLVTIARSALAARRHGVVEAAGRRVFNDLLLPRPRLWIAGAGHVGRAVARHAAACEFEVKVVDDRPDLCSAEQIPWATDHLVGDIEATLSARTYGPDDYVVIVTRGHHHDADALRAVIGSSARYLGLIGSRRKIKLLTAGLLDEGTATPEQFARLFAPIGLDIGAQTVDEIAICIVAELIAVRRGKLTLPAER